MDETKVLQRAIDDLYSDLPGLIGAEWSDFKAQLDTHLERLKADASRASFVRAQILALFGDYQQAHQRLVEQMAQYRDPRSDSTTRSARDAARGVVTRYTDITCPRRVWVESPRVPVVVRLAVKRPEHSAAEAKLSVRQSLPVQVHMDAPHFEILNQSIQEITIESQKDSSPIVFDLRPCRPGHTQITLDFFQGGQPLRSVPLAVEVTLKETAEDTQSKPMHAVHLDKDVKPPDRVLHIGWDPLNSSLRFTLIQNGGAFWRTFEPKDIKVDPAAQATELYRKVNIYGAGLDPSMKEIHSRRSSVPREIVDGQIRRLGHHIWQDFIPSGLKRLYEQERDEWSQGTMLVYSDEPHLPWELTWPFDDRSGEWEDKEPWCHSLCLTRWLRQGQQDNGNQMAPARLELGSIAVLAPTSSRFPRMSSAQAERNALLELMQRFRVEDVAPADSKWADLMRFLEGSGYDWVHIAAHGNFQPMDQGGNAVLWLQQDDAFMPWHMTGARITRHLRRQRPAFFFNACEMARQSWGRNEIGGWADQLIALGASLFVGPLWNVKDSSATVFATTFYEHLLAGKRMAEAVRKARSAAREAGDSTWLAYSVFGHPNATVDLEKRGD